MKFENSVSRRSFIVGAAGVATLGLAACGGNGAKKEDASGGEKKADAQTLIVFAAASLTESLTEAGELFKNDNQGVDISFNFDSSGTLKTQIEEGSDCDVFISAGQKQMNQLDANAKKDHDKDLDFIASDTRFDILENKVTLCVPQDNPKAVQSFDDMAQKLGAGEILLGMGNSDVPVGQYTQKKRLPKRGISHTEPMLRKLLHRLKKLPLIAALSIRPMLPPQNFRWSVRQLRRCADAWCILLLQPKMQSRQTSQRNSLSS